MQVGNDQEKAQSEKDSHSTGKYLILARQREAMFYPEWEIMKSLYVRQRHFFTMGGKLFNSCTSDRDNVLPWVANYLILARQRETMFYPGREIIQFLHVRQRQCYTLGGKLFNSCMSGRDNVKPWEGNYSIVACQADTMFYHGREIVQFLHFRQWQCFTLSKKLLCNSCMSGSDNVLPWVGNN